MKISVHKLCLTVLVGLLLSEFVFADRIIHREKSLYRNILVKESGDRRCLVFSVKRQHRNQTCMDMNDHNRVVFPYVRMTFAGLLLNTSPARTLMIGLGGGTISNVLTDLYPQMVLDLVEVDPAVVNVARDYFDFRESSKTNVHTIDGRVFTKRAVLRGIKYDLIILDAFTGEYIPEHLMTADFLQEVKALLSPGGARWPNSCILKLMSHGEEEGAPEGVTWAAAASPPAAGLPKRQRKYVLKISRDAAEGVCEIPA